jgi:hypothetical protein
MLGLEIYIIISYIGGALFTIMTLAQARVLSVADILFFFLSPFAIMPILFVQLISQFVDVDKPVIKL